MCVQYVLCDVMSVGNQMEMIANDVVNIRTQFQWIHCHLGLIPAVTEVWPGSSENALSNCACKSQELHSFTQYCLKTAPARRSWAETCCITVFCCYHLVPDHLTTNQYLLQWNFRQLVIQITNAAARVLLNPHPMNVHGLKFFCKDVFIFTHKKNII